MLGISSGAYRMTIVVARALLFDLDGTLTDPSRGITRCIAYALEHMGTPVPEAAALREWVGPPLREMFAAALGSEEHGEQALALYRERFGRIGLYENELYAGVPALLAALREQGTRLLLATGKPQPYARRILEYFGLLDYFALVGGATFDGTVNSKAEVIATLLPHLSAAERTGCVMIGDREHDVVGARAHGLPCIAVGYGFGSAAELRACCPAYHVGSVAELHALLCGT
jgi:phosphoglycolate phosphatase